MHARGRQIAPTVPVPHLFTLCVNEQLGHPDHKHFSLGRAEVLQQLLTFCFAGLTHSLSKWGYQRNGKTVASHKEILSVDGDRL